MDIRKSKDVPLRLVENCHGGEGTLLCRNLLADLGSTRFRLLHSDMIPAGVSIGRHEHLKNEEIYYLLSGRGILTLDDRRWEMDAGDVSLCPKGHSHAFEATEDSVLLVIATAFEKQEEIQ